MADWLTIESAPLNKPVLTMISDEHGDRNECVLVQKQRDPTSRPMWWTPDGSMYVYYTPTHWRPVSDRDQ